MNITAIAIGAIVSWLVIRGLRSRGLHDSPWGYPAVLASFPIYYWAFALWGGDARALPAEAMAGLAFFAIALLAARWRSRTSLLVLAFGYVAHAAYDVFHHHLISNAGVPPWWPEFCGSVDLIVGLQIAWLALGTRRAQSPQGPLRPRLAALSRPAAPRE